MEGPPEPIISDYVELATLVLLFVIGGPLNLAAYTQVLHLLLSFYFYINMRFKKAKF